MKHSIGAITQLKIELTTLGVDYLKFKQKKEYEQVLIVKYLGFGVSCFCIVKYLEFIRYFKSKT